MAEVQARSQAPSSRGRGGGRGGRGGFGSRSSANRRTNGDKPTAVDSAAFDDDGDVSQLRKQYGGKLDTIKELFPTWSDADILYALKETDGDIEVTATRIAEGTISQWDEVSKQKKAAIRPKAKEASTSTGPADLTGNGRPARGGRSDGARGGRARGNERGRGSGRGRAAPHTTTNGHRFKENQQLSVPTEESSGWGNTASNDEPTTNEPHTDSTTETATISAPATTTAEVTLTKPHVIPQGTQKTWASMLRQSTAPKPAPKPKDTPAPKPAEVLEPLPPAEPTPEPAPQPAVEETPKEVVEPPAPAETPKVVEPEVALPPPEDDLTRVNLEQLPDESKPPATATAASTTADSWDPRQPQQSTTATPLSASRAQHQATRPAVSGFATTALKATERPTTRMPSHQRRILEQEEAVRMPGNREVDRAAVQFGAFSLNGVEDDIDGDREDPETRTQPPPESPVAVPRASLPPVSQPAAVPDSFPTAQKPATTLPSAPGTAGTIPFHAHHQKMRANHRLATPVAPPTGPAATTAQPPQAPSSNPQFGRYGQTNAGEPASFSQKPYDTFGQQTATTSAGLDSFPAPTTQAPGPQASGAFSSAPEYSSYYQTADPQTRSTYNTYYGQQFAQHGAQSHHEPANAPNRGFGGYGANQTDNLSQYPQSGTQQTRYGAAASAESHNSGHNTPNPIGQGGQQTSGQTNQPQSNLHQQPHANQYPYQHPYYSSPYYAQYISQYNGGYGQGGYAGAPYGKGGLYGQPHQYGMSPQGPYDHGSSPATSGFGQSTLGGRDTGLNSSIDNYGRAGSAQSGAPGLGASGFGGVHDTFGRGSGYPSQAGQSFNAPNAPTSNAGSGTDDLKPYGDSKTGAGPSPSLAAAARPGSATNTTPAGSGLPPPQSTQGMGAYAGYPSHLSHGLHGNQSGGSGYGLGGTAGQGHGNTPYGGYGGNQGFANYYGGRQQQGGWGGNYH
ncbi:RNAPII degradation factor [Parahypoxylon ruwenzoriense]